MTDLLPCPFCEVTGVILSDGRHEWALFEHKDSCLFPNVHKHEIPACDFEAWNTRTFKAVYEDGNLCRIVTDTDTYIPERTCHITSEEYDDLLDMFTTNFSCGHYGIGMARWFKHCPECGARVLGANDDGRR